MLFALDEVAVVLIQESFFGQTNIMRSIFTWCMWILVAFIHCKEAMDIFC